jgi:hypothetical protein
MFKLTGAKYDIMSTVGHFVVSLYVYVCVGVLCVCACWYEYEISESVHERNKDV